MACACRSSLTALGSNLIMVAVFPILTATFAMLLLDRCPGFHFFRSTLAATR
jgi:cytochrome o ubiquinol oxidase subunit 1